MCKRCNNCGIIIEECEKSKKTTPCLPDWDNYCPDCADELKM